MSQRSAYGRDASHLASSKLADTRAETFEQVVDRQAERLVSCLVSAFLDRETAADAAQEAFIQLYKHWAEVTKTGSPDAWLYRVAFNRCKDHHRSMIRMGRLIERLGSAASAHPQVVDWAPRAEFLSVLEQLPTRQRVAAALYYDADLTTAEIARTMGISEGAVNSHLHRARTTLKKMLEDM